MRRRDIKPGVIIAFSDPYMFDNVWMVHEIKGEYFYMFKLVGKDAFNVVGKLNLNNSKHLRVLG